MKELIKNWWFNPLFHCVGVILVVLAFGGITKGGESGWSFLLFAIGIYAFISPPVGVWSKERRIYIILSILGMIAIITLGSICVKWNILIHQSPDLSLKDIRMPSSVRNNLIPIGLFFMLFTAIIHGMRWFYVYTKNEKR